MASRSKLAAVLVALVLAGGCSKQPGPSILGHWQAERMSVYSAKLPIGPDIVVSRDAMSLTDSGASLSISKIEAGGDEATVDFAHGIGVTFHFDGADRMYVQVPLIGRVYYRRVPQEGVVAASGQAGASQGTAADGGVRRVSASADRPAVPVATSGDEKAPPQSGGPTVRPVAGALTAAAGNRRAGNASSPLPADYEQASIAARAGDADATIGHLNDAFKAGFRQFDQLDAAPEFASLKSDVRYQALIARYR
ncbi:hypothetical protein LIG30_4090 [Burkholderia sp. lig30]|jgi:hypothetical protein|uniref:hypothetical protein n=1 Tax=Burkholderia sp. lig30 TaxID=1192124 RepID=UPI000462066E|nr:hypothetical protein [Burkholderia sp. lig30]KDB06535.1 hypothetical protein LIG30_4090 [Burkholderia sp. lig30]